MKHFLAFYWLELIITVAVWILIGWKLGLAAFLITVILSMLEITLSADNAVVNSRVLVKMSELWQKLFMTVGIFIAVFVVRFALPIVLVSVAAGLDMGTTLALALNDPEAYGKELHDIAPMIDGFGGIFLLMVALFFFVDRERKDLWLKGPERALQFIAKVPTIRILIIMAIFVAIQFMLGPEKSGIVAASMAVGIVVYLLLHGVTRLMEKNEKDISLHKQVGWTAFASFLYLEVLDASFSLDGVVGAFALTDNIIIIMAGLGIGAMWVRALTLYMVKHHTLVKYRYLESGAHWAILCLSLIMFLKLFHIELPELLVGSIGLVFIAGAVWSSRKPTIATS